MTRQIVRPTPVRAFLATTQVGDIITMRDKVGGKLEAKVCEHGTRFVIVQFCNQHQRLSYKTGKVYGFDDWGVDIEAPVQRIAARREFPERAKTMLRGIKAGDKVPLIGYPPLDGMKRKATVIRTDKHYVTLKMGARVMRMFKSGPLAGIVNADVFVLDTTDAEAAR